MAASAALAVVGQGGTVLWGTTGVTLPTSGTAATTGLNDLGYLDEDGLTVTVTPTIQELNVWQSAQPVRRALQNQGISLSGNFAEHNTHTVPRAFGGGSLAALASPGGTYAFIDPIVNGLEEFAVCADVTDGSTDRVRYTFARVNQTEASEVSYNRQNLAVLPFSFGVLAPTAGGSPGTAFVLNT
jgi:hypothetical protein